jgi:vacuolar iron transporter family protein
MVTFLYMGKRITLREKGELLRDAVLSSSDGLITTFAIVAGAKGADFNSNVVLIIGIGNLLADGISMVSGNYLGIKSEMEMESRKRFKITIPILRELWATFLPFVIIGAIPLFPYLFAVQDAFFTSLSMVFITLFFIGCFRGIFTKRNYIRSGIESLAIGGIAAFLAYGIGYLAQYIAG